MTVPIEFRTIGLSFSTGGGRGDGENTGMDVVGEGEGEGEEEGEGEGEGVKGIVVSTCAVVTTGILVIAGTVVVTSSRVVSGVRDVVRMAAGELETAELDEGIGPGKQTNIPWSARITEQISLVSQGLGSHGVRSISHIAPVNSEVHRQKKLPGTLKQAPSFKQGIVSHSSMSKSHNCPV